jgi:hypothetical protein
MTDWRRPLDNLNLPLTQVHRFATREELSAAFPDLASQVPSYELAAGEVSIGYEVIRWRLGEGQIGGHERTAIWLLVRASEPASAVRRVGMWPKDLGEVSTWEQMEHLLVSDAPPPLEPASAMNSLKAAAGWANPARVWLAQTDAHMDRPEWADVPEPTRNLVKNARIAIECAYRAGRFMREAELSQHESSIKRSAAVLTGGKKGGDTTGPQNAETAVAWRAAFAPWAQSVHDELANNVGKPISRARLCEKIEELKWPGFATQKVRPERATLMGALRLMENAGLLNRPAAPRGRKPKQK